MSSLIFDPPPKKSAHHGPMYCRSTSIARGRFESAMLALYDKKMPAYMAEVFPSGMAAIMACFHGITRTRPGCLVMGNELYCDVARTAKYLRLDVRTVDIRDHVSLMHLFENNTVCIFHYESCTNPSGQMIDPALIQKLRALAPSCVFICDNTWLSPILFNPFDHGADIVVESCTKYLSGSQCIGGVVCGLHDAMQPVLEWCCVAGQYTTPTTADLFTSSLASLKDRVMRAGSVALSAAQWLEHQPEVDRVMYPLLASHPTHAIAATCLKQGGPGCVWVHLKNVSKNKLIRLLIKHQDGFEYKTSYGGPKSRIDPWPKSAPRLEYEWPKDTTASTPPGCWVRVSIGFDDTMEDFIRQWKSSPWDKAM